MDTLSQRRYIDGAFSNEAQSGHRKPEVALTFVEFLVIVAVVAVLAGPCLPAYRHLGPAPRMSCMNHLEQINLAFRMYAAGNEDKFPWESATTNQNLAGNATVALPAAWFQVFSNELGGSPRVLWCPSDLKRSPSTTFTAGFGSANVSYFINVGATVLNSPAILSGDRNLEGSVKNPGGYWTFTNNATARWGNGLHKRAGNIALANGSVVQANDEWLQQALGASRGVSNRFYIP
jgi:hypothetical protein